MKKGGSTIYKKVGGGQQLLGVKFILVYEYR